jgi:hypothetical protein
MLKYLAPLAFALAGCSTNSALEPPVVDMSKVSPQKFAQDQAECQERGKGAVVIGHPITDCMRDRGYTILVPKS